MVRAPGLDLQPREPVMPQQRFVPLRELVRMLGLVHRRRQSVGAVLGRRAAQFPQRVLQTVAQALEALREADRPRLPVRLGQDEVVD